jgi:signal transduction histidine kinase
MVCGAGSFAAWILFIQSFIHIATPFVPLNPAAAVVLVCAGVALCRLVCAQRVNKTDALASILAIVPILAGCTRIAEMIGGPEVERITRLILFEQVGAAPATFSTQLAPNTAIAFILFGLALLLFRNDSRGFVRFSQALAIFAGLIALLTLVGYTYEIFVGYHHKRPISMSLETAIALGIFSAGFLAARPSRGIMELITSSTTGGAVVRRLLPVAILIPWLLGGVFLFVEEWTLFQAQAAISLFAVSSIVIFSGLIIWHAKMLYRADVERTIAEHRLRDASLNLERSNTELQQFAYVASHDLFEPLRMVTSYVQLLRERNQGKLDKSSEEFIGFAIDGAQRMKALITDLLAYSRLEVRAPAFEAVNIEDVVKAVTSNLKVAIEESCAVIRSGPLPTVMGDRVQLIQVLQNFIGNAIKFRGKNVPVVDVNATREGPDWVFSVKDNGIGIDPKFFERIFVIFQRLHNRTEYTGTGIGLAVCKKIIERSGGRVWVESKPGEGSTFLFTLPAKPD